MILNYLYSMSRMRRAKLIEVPSVTFFKVGVLKCYYFLQNVLYCNILLVSIGVISVEGASENNVHETTTVKNVLRRSAS